MRSIFAAWFARVACVLFAVIALNALSTGAVVAADCLQLGMSDVAFGKEAATQSAWEKLDEYAGERARGLGWNDTTKSNARFVSCEVYLDLGLIGTEYRCLVRATYCPQ